MALIDYRKLIDGLRDIDGDAIYATVEAIAGTDTESPIVALDVYLANRATPIVQLRLDEGDAGAIFDSLGGALRAIATAGTVHA